MHIEIHILPDHFPIDPDSWHREMSSLMGRIEQLIMDGTINLRAYAKGKTTLLAEDGSGMIVATIDIRRE